MVVWTGGPWARYCVTREDGAALDTGFRLMGPEKRKGRDETTTGEMRVGAEEST